MKPVKVAVDPTAVHAFMLEHSVFPTLNVVPVAGGERSHAFYLQSRGKKLILRLNLDWHGFTKDAKAAEIFAHSSVPVPSIIFRDRFDSRHHYAVSNYAEGAGLYEFGTVVPKNVVQQVADCLDNIHNSRVIGNGYGVWQSEAANAPHATWSGAIRNIQTIYDWQTLFRRGLAERHLVENIYHAMLELLPYCPEERWLVHGDFKGANIRHDGQGITGVLDWSESMYGDFLFDVAWIDLWDEYTGYRRFFYEHYMRKGKMDIDFYHQRVTCYQYYGALLSLGFNASTNQPAKYERVKNRLYKLGLLQGDSVTYRRAHSALRA